MYYLPPPPAFLSHCHNNCGYILFYDDADATLMLSHYRINQRKNNAAEDVDDGDNDDDDDDECCCSVTGNQTKPIMDPGKQR